MCNPVHTPTLPRFSSYDSLPEVDVHMVTQRHLVGYSPQTDLLPLVLAHCNYSLHLGGGGFSRKLDYDYQGMEMQLRNTLLMGKSRVRRHAEYGAFQVSVFTLLFLFFSFLGGGGYIIWFVCMNVFMECAIDSSNHFLIIFLIFIYFWTVFQIETLTFCADTTNSSLVNKLREKINQVTLF
jgi:hypothetical protein